MPGLCSLQTRQAEGWQECLRSLFRKLQRPPPHPWAGAGSAGQPLGSVFFAGPFLCCSGQFRVHREPL